MRRQLDSRKKGENPPNYVPIENEAVPVCGQSPRAHRVAKISKYIIEAKESGARLYTN
jgi:hypothetical protein